MDWFFLYDRQPLKAAENMARDQHLLELVESGAIHGAVLRIYQWARPTLSLGYHQKWERSIVPDALTRHGVDLVRRWTGGRAVLHINELTYSVIAPYREPFKKKVSHNYEVLAHPLKQFTEKLMLDARLANKPNCVESPAGSARSSPCFASLSEDEIQTGEKKLIGSSQKLSKGAFLQHGSVPLEDHAELLSELTGTDIDISEYMETVGGLYRKAGWQLPEFNSLVKAMKDSFEEILGMTFMVRDLQQEFDIQRLSDLVTNQFSHHEWTFRF